MSELYRLQNSIQSYAWGSRTVLAELQGRPVPSAGPEAELWVGAHPSAPSHIPGAGSLGEAIAAEPARLLGPGLDRLPFLLKILAVGRPLSIQVHPDADQAVRGFAREAGLAAGDPARSYHDDCAKPELIYAVTPFEALCGFRDPLDAAKDLQGERLTRVADALLQGGHRAAVSLLSRWPREDRGALVEEVRPAGEDWTLRLADAYPDDPGVIVALLLNRVVLAPGQALYARPRTIHAYLHGTGVEIMASSDNVLRGGLTPKHIDLDELLEVTSFAPARPETVEPVRLPNGEDLFPAPATQFQLTRLRPAPRLEITDPGPGAILCLDGSLEIGRGSRTEILRPGEALFLPYEGGPVRVGGSGLGFRAALPEPIGRPHP
ncbi:MAG: mannose-6-phosphate isomerase, class I [Streptosporangiaceae bacterium]